MFEIVDANGNALSFEERWARINASRNTRQVADAAVGFGKSAQLNRDVVRFNRNVDPTAVRVDHKMDVGITDGERRDRAAKPTGAKVHGHADAEHSPQFGLHARGAEARFFYFGCDAFAVLVKRMTDVGDRELAAPLFEQDGAELIFQKHQLAADSGFWNVELLRCAANAASIDDFEKQQQRVEVQFSCHELRSSVSGFRHVKPNQSSHLWNSKSLKMRYRPDFGKLRLDSGLPLLSARCFGPAAAKPKSKESCATHGSPEEK